MTDSRAQMQALLDSLAERIARIVESSRGVGDVPDHQRGEYFPPELIVRDARAARTDSVDAIAVNQLPDRLQQLQRTIGLNEIELGILVTALAVALEPRFEQFYIVLNNEVGTRGPNIATAIKLSGADADDPEARALLRADSRLRAFGLLTVHQEDRALLTRVITVPERVVSFLLGDDVFDPSIISVLNALNSDVVPADMLPELPMIEQLPVILRARAGTAPREQSRRLSLEVAGLPPLIVEGRKLSADAAECAGQLRACLREAALWGTLLVLDLRYATPGMSRSAMFDLLAEVGMPFVAIVEARAALDDWAGSAVSLALPDRAMREQWWAHFGAKDLTAAAGATHVEPTDLQRHIAEGTPLAPHVVAGRGLSAPITAEFRLADVLTSAEVTRELLELRNRVLNRPTVLDDWGLRPGGGRGRGVTALFSGGPGTGKTMAAEALAGELGVPLFRVDLAAVVDKYIGETEKNLERVFSSVEDVDGVLLFDEADALFGKRSDVSDARDRYANLEVAYLLQRMESFDGLAILTTNLRANLDTAFLRRLDSVVDFPEPDQEIRESLWLACLTGHEGLVGKDDVRRLASLPMSGGAIRAAVVTAAYLSAEQGAGIDRMFLLQACEREWRKIGRLSFPNADFAEWYPEALNGVRAGS